MLLRAKGSTHAVMIASPTHTAMDKAGGQPGHNSAIRYLHNPHATSLKVVDVGRCHCSTSSTRDRDVLSQKKKKKVVSRVDFRFSFSTERRAEEE